MVLQINKPLKLPTDWRTELAVSDEVEGVDFFPYLLVGGVGFVVSASGILLLVIGGVWAAVRLSRQPSSQ
ncbi:MAG: hypothetical protein ABSH20_23685 [Tepidisphaeraceae bacterium]|jgi:hypothetical protein